MTFDLNSVLVCKITESLQGFVRTSLSRGNLVQVDGFGTDPKSDLYNCADDESPGHTVCIARIHEVVLEVADVFKQVGSD